MTTGMKNMGLSSYKERIGGEVHQEVLLIYYYMGKFPPLIIMPRNNKRPSMQRWLHGGSVWSLRTRA